MNNLPDNYTMSEYNRDQSRLDHDDYKEAVKDSQMNYIFQELKADDMKVLEAIQRLMANQSKELCEAFRDATGRKPVDIQAVNDLIYLELSELAKEEWEGGR